MIPFNKPHLTGREADYIADVLASGKLSGDGPFTKAAQGQLEELLGSGRCFLTTSCTDALEAAALLCELEPGDEVIVPSYTFVSTANAFALRGATIRFADSLPNHPNIDPESVASLVNERTRAIVPVHYAGMACDMDSLVEIAKANDLIIVEDAAQAIDSYYRGKALGTFGRFAAFSFHETKNLVSGEGGALVVNDEGFVRQAEIVREKGTDRAAFFRGEINKYGWQSLGSSYLPSELIAAFLLAQLEGVAAIQRKRVALWDRYAERLGWLSKRGDVELPIVPNYATNNGHMFYLVCRSLEARTRLIDHLRKRDILAVFHYQSLHASAFFQDRHDGRLLPHSDRFTDTLVRLPLYADLTEAEQDCVIEAVNDFFA